MKTKSIGSVFLLFTIVTGIIAMSPTGNADYLHPIHPAFADHHEVTITPVSGSGSGPGCELTDKGCYSPNTVTVYVGSLIIFSNTDSVKHTFTSGSPSDDVIGTEFNSGMVEPGAYAEWTPENVGEFPYFDMIHPWMQGTIIVQEAGDKTHSEMETHTEEPAVVEEPAIVEEVVEEPAIVEEVVEEPAIVEEVVEEPATAPQESSEEGGGCLIATAAYGSELAPQVQMLREIRDNQLMNTESGSAFMTTFNEAYYSFSPYIADLERESPIFKEIVKAGLTPMISTLSIMESAETESEVLGLGLSVIALNLGMYIGLPAFGIVKAIQLRKN
ncbi:MAG: CFI-box-CTERM domain-containing protein [Nitrosopumilus sp.]